MTDPITDMLNRIRNAQAVLKPSVRIPWSNLKFKIAKTLQEEGFVGEVRKKGKKPRKYIEIELKYETLKREVEGAVNPLKEVIPVISGLKRISKPGQRIYKGYRQIRPVKGGYGIAIISTSQGIMTDKEARRRKLGGEILCEIW
jgi:small subunit ribosomal protein S8